MFLAGKIIDKQLSLSGVYEYTVLAPNGQVLYPAYITGGGGTAKSFQHTPYEEGAEVVLATANSAGHAPYYILAGIPSPGDLARINVFVPPVEGQSVSSTNAGDYCVRLGSALFSLTASSTAVTAATAINQQLNGGALRISQQGVAENQLLNAQNTIDTLVQYIEQLNVKIAALQQAVQSSAPAVQAAYTAAITAATAAGNPVLADQLTQQAIDSASAIGALATTPPLTDSGTINTSLSSGINQHIRVP